MKVIIAGSRAFNDYELLKKVCDKELGNYTDIEIVSGTANGADLLGEKYAEERNYPVKKFPADWSLGKQAGYLRNYDMVQYSEMLICFWDGKSNGSKSVIRMAKKRGLKVIVQNF